MVPVSPALFMVAIRSAFRLGAEFRSIHAAKLRDKAYSVALPPIDVPAILTQALQLILAERNLFGPGHFEGLLDDSGGPVLNPAATPGMIAAAIEHAEKRNASRMAAAAASTDAKTALAIGRPAVQVLEGWLDPNAKKLRYGRLGLTMLDIALEATATQPNVFGLKGKAETLISALAGNVEALLGPDEELGTNASSLNEFMERGVSVFLEASLSTISQHPDLVLPGQEQLAALTKDVMTPLKQQLSDARAQHAGLPALDQLRATLRGPVAHAAFKAVSDNPDAFLTGKLGGDKALGAITRSIFQAAAGISPDDFNIRRAFSQDGIALVYGATMKTAADHPELFIQGEGARTDAARDLLTGICGTMANAPPPFDAASGLGPQLAAVALDVGREHAARWIAAQAKPGQPADSGGWAGVSTQLINSVILGFSDAVRAGALRDPKALQKLGRTQALELVKIIALEAAKTPGLVVGERANGEVKAIAGAVAAFIAEEPARLASAEDWRLITAVALAEAAKNPATLFSIDPKASPTSHVAVSLISTVLSSAAKANQAGRAPGVLMFGETLREALISTLKAAANNARPLLAGDLAARQTHLAGLARFCDQLNALSASPAMVGRMGAAEWLTIYRWYIAHVIDQGPNAKITDAMMTEILTRKS